MYFADGGEESRLLVRPFTPRWIEIILSKGCFILLSNFSRKGSSHSTLSWWYVDRDQSRQLMAFSSLSFYHIALFFSFSSLLFWTIYKSYYSAPFQPYSRFFLFKNCFQRSHWTAMTSIDDWPSFIWPV